MKLGTRLLAAAFSLAIVAAPASGQLPGLPVYNYVPAATGVTLSGMFGRGLNDDSGKLNSAGGMLTYGSDMFWIGAGASYVDFDALKDVGFGGNAGYILPLGPDMPVKVGIVAGASYISNDLGTLGTVKTLFVPAGATLAINVPSTGVAVTPWASPQFRYYRLSNGSSVSESNFGVSGGVNIVLPMGVGLSLAGDYDAETKGFVAGVGLQYTFKVGGSM